MEEEVLKTLSINIKYYRQFMRLERTELAAKTGVSYNTLARIEQSKANPRLDTLILLADYFNISVAVLFIRKEVYKYE